MEPETDHMDPSDPTEELARLIKNAADLQIRIVTWRVLDGTDYRALEADIRGLDADIEALRAAVQRERNRMHIPDDPKHTFDFDEYTCMHCGRDRDNPIHGHV